MSAVFVGGMPSPWRAWIAAATAFVKASPEAGKVSASPDGWTVLTVYTGVDCPCRPVWLTVEDGPCEPVRVGLEYCPTSPATTWHGRPMVVRVDLKVGGNYRPRDMIHFGGPPV